MGERSSIVGGRRVPPLFNADGTAVLHTPTGSLAHVNPPGFESSVITPAQIEEAQREARGRRESSIPERLRRRWDEA
jgi:hypothetical protein